MKKIKLSIAAAAFLCLLSSQLMAKPLVLGLIPAENNEEMIQTFEPMRKYLEQKIGRHIKVFTATNYAGVIEGMKKGRVDIAWFGPLSYVLAEQEAGAEAFAVGVRKSTGKSTYRSLFVVQGDSSIHSIKDLKGKSVAFVDPASTSGGLVPTYMIKKATGMMPKDYFGKFTYAGSHDAAEMAVKNKTVDAAADNDITYPKLIRKGMITKESNRVLVYSDPLPGSPMAYRKDLSEELKRNIRDAILYAHYSISPTGYGSLIKYEQAAPADYQGIRDLVHQLGLTRNDILK